MDEWGPVSQFAATSTRCLTRDALPFGVRDLEDPPKRLYLTGTLPPGPRVAIVGTRTPTKEAYAYTQALASELAQAGVVVVSGGALGIDTAAHEGALRAGAGTLVVAPSSFDCPYPEQNRGLFHRVVERGGGYLTFFDTPTVARRHVFFARNALMVSLCATLVIVQAPLRSGARNAALWARTLGRPYWVVPHSPWCMRGSSSVAELRLGGRPLATAKELRSWLTEQRLHAVPHGGQMGGEMGETPDDDKTEALQRTPGAGAPEDCDNEATQRLTEGNFPQLDICRLVSALRPGPRHPDELCSTLNWQPARLQSTVLHGTLMGEVARTDSGLIALVSQKG